MKCMRCSANDWSFGQSGELCQRCGYWRPYSKNSELSWLRTISGVFALIPVPAIDRDSFFGADGTPAQGMGVRFETAAPCLWYSTVFEPTGEMFGFAPMRSLRVTPAPHPGARPLYTKQRHFVLGDPRFWLANDDMAEMFIEHSDVDLLPYLRGDLLPKPGLPAALVCAAEVQYGAGVFDAGDGRGLVATIDYPHTKYPVTLTLDRWGELEELLVAFDIGVE